MVTKHLIIHTEHLIVCICPGYMQIKQQYHKIEPQVTISFVSTIERDTEMHAYILVDMKQL
jgi:hypothetical protein